MTIIEHDNIKEEIWKPIPGYEGLYDASSFGRIRSTPGRNTRTCKQSRILKEKRSPRQRELRGRDDARVTLWNNGQHRDFKVSRLIAMTFHGLPDVGMTVNHINGNWNDNRPENLEWLTNTENQRHARAIGLICDKKPISLVDDDCNVYTFDCILDASKFLGRQRNYLYIARNKHLQNAYSVDGKKYRFYLMKDAVQADDNFGRCQ